MEMNWKHILIYALLPAIIAGASSIAPKLYDIAMEPKSELIFQEVNGPEIQSKSTFQRVISITITNSGKRLLNNTIAELNVEGGKIEAFKIQENTGIKPATITSDNEVKIKIQKIHQGERLTISALLSSETAGTQPKFTLRSDEILGIKKPENANKKDTAFLSGIAAALSVFMMATMLIVAKTKYLSGALANHKQDHLFYIPARLGMHEISKSLAIKTTELTYLRMADILLAYGLASNEKSKSIIALKSMLLIRDMAETSKNIVIKNIKTLEDAKFNENQIASLSEKSVNSNKIMEFRALVDELIYSTDC